VSQVRSVEEILYLAAGRLGHLRERVVFVGGAVRGLLITDPAVEGPRPTKDVDVIVEVSPRSAYYQLEEELRDLGFKNDTREGAPQCRFVHGELTLDVMPTDAATLGFSNPWYPHALRTAWESEIGVPRLPRLPIRVVSAACFVATKLVSYANRGGGDPFHHDLEDIIALVDGRPTLIDEVEAEPEELRRFISDELARLFAEGLEDHVPGHLPGDAANQARLPLVLARLRRLEQHG
jgi:hypothetical protein